MELEEWGNTSVTMAQVTELAKRLANMQREVNAITSQGEYEIQEMADAEDVAQIVSHA